VSTTLPTTSETGLEAYFAALLEGFARARQARGTTTVHWTIAGRAVNLVLAGNALAPLTRPLEHAQTNNNSLSDFTIHAWEGPEDWQPPEPLWQHTAGEDSVGLCTSRFRINYHEPSRLLCLWDRQSRRAVYWVRRAIDLPFWEIASPFRILFHWWAQSWGGQVAHAAAVGVDGRGVLLVGRSGSGKSTAALACLRHGLDFVGDDYVLLTAGPAPAAHCLYSSAKMHAASLAQYFPEWQGHVGTRVGPESKCVLYLRDLDGIRLRPRLDLCAIVTPQVTADPYPAITPASPAQTWLALVPSTVFQLPDARQTTLAFFSTFARKLPSFGLTTGRDLQRLPEVLRDFLTSQPLPSQEARHA
jgi:hypothetical protein